MSNEMMNDELPEGWTKTKLPEVAFFQEGPGLRKFQYRDAGIPFLNIRTLVNERVDRSMCKYLDKVEVEQKYEHFLLQEGDIVCSTSGTLGKLATIQQGDLPIMLNTSVVRFRTLNPAVVMQRFVKLYLKSELFLAQALAASTGSAQVNIGPSHLKEFEIHVPPLAEQKRIADKLEAVLGRVDACRARLDRVPDLLKRFRQSVLAAATSGQLTEDWRGIDTASDLEQYLGQITDRNRDSEPTSGHDILTSRFPQEWAVSTIGKLFRFIDYRGRNPNKSATGKRLITAKNIRMGRLNDSPIEFISESDYQEWMTRGFPAQGDILFVTEGHTMGFTALNERDDEFALAQRIITLQPYAVLCSKFYFYVMLTDAFQQLVAINATGSAAQGIKASKLRDLPFPFPSLAEQAEIVRRVEALFALADRIEARLATAQRLVERLTPATLSKAFRGDLVAQDPNDEPAERLLKQIQAGGKPQARPRQNNPKN